MSEAEIVSCAIHPAIGIARVGNSPDEYFIGPEVPDAVPSLPAAFKLEPGAAVEVPALAPGFKDPSGCIRRQAARFRVYGYDRDGNVVKELTSANTQQILWTVHLANKKAAWYCFKMSLDIPEGEPAARRNPAITGADRSQLIIDPGPRSLPGPSMSVAFAGGTFMNVPVDLGVMRTGPMGRLLVLGGTGVSATPLPDQYPLHTYADNAGWHDDVSDGPVSARVTIDGKTLDAKGAWVIVAPPNYAPGIRDVVTMYDVVYEAATQMDPGVAIKPPTRPSFTQHVYPLFERLCRGQWVNEGFSLLFGWGAPWDFLEESMLTRLADASEQNRSLRRRVFNRFRNPDYKVSDPNGWPPMYGDGEYIQDYPDSPRQWLAITKLQYAWLKRWAEGDFVADWNPKRRTPDRIEQIKLADQPSALDRTALEECLGGAFHPGCEATWPMRRPVLYSEPFRIRPRDPNVPEPDWGDLLVPARAIATDGPLSSSGPGDITRWMAVPWQADAASCRSGYTPTQNVNLPTFWPARVPNHTLQESSHRQVMNTKLTLAQRLKLLSLRQDWLRDICAYASYQDGLTHMIAHWSHLGILERRRGPTDTPHFPAEVFVETGNTLEVSEAGAHARANARIGP